MAKLTKQQINSARCYLEDRIGAIFVDAVIERVAELTQYAPTEPGAPLSDVEWSEIMHRAWSLIRREPKENYRKVADLALAMRNTAQPALKEQQCDGSCDNDWCTAVPAPAPIISAAQDDWNDQHGHRTEILPLIGGEAVKKEKAAPVDGDLVERALIAFHDGGASLSGIRRHEERMTAVVRLLADELLGPVTFKERKQHHDLFGFSPSAVDTFLAARRTRIDAKPQTLEERIHAILIGSDDVTDKFKAFVALIPSRDANREAL